MKKLTFEAALLTMLGAIACSAETYTPGEPVSGTYESFAAPFINNYCIDCHDDTTSKGDLMLHDIGPVDETNAAIWKSVWAQATLQEMPPKKEFQPLLIERLQFSEWIVAELQRVTKDEGGFTAHLDPKKANFLNHDLLFGQLPEEIQLVPTSSPARIWRVTPEEHITRLNELINIEPEYDPEKPGLRTHGDAVPTNHGGELKLYFGTDQIIKWQGGTVAYATAVKSVPAVLSSNRKHGFENYADFNSVNSAESTQILGMAENILRFMAYGPLSIANPEQITDDPDSYEMVGDIRGLPTSLVYSTEVKRPLTPVYDLMKAPEFTDELLLEAVNYLFEALTFRPPLETESAEYMKIVKDSIAKIGNEDGAFMGLSAIFLDRDALFRPELAEGGKPDEHGRVMLQDWELGLAVNHSLRYLKPDEELRKAIVEGRMRTKQDVEREVSRMLEDDSIRKPRILRFFRDYFDHDLAGYICKDFDALTATGVKLGFANNNAHYLSMFGATASTDRLIELILEQDINVLKQLLTTQQVVANGKDRTYFGRRLTKEEEAASNKEQLEAMSDEDAATLKVLDAEAAELEARFKADTNNNDIRKALARKTKEIDAFKRDLQEGKKKKGAGGNKSVAEADLKGPKIYARVSRRSFGNGSMDPERILATAPEGQRLGILTHPAWLVSHTDAMDNHAIHRGIWIRERLLGGGIPDVPITVDAMLPDEPDHTLRERMRVTREKSCYVCHEKMDPLGLPFEMYNHAGIFRTTEQDKPVDTSGEIIDSGDPQLDGPVENAIDMIQKLAESERVEQVFVRHAFRFWMGRNETIHDRPVIQAAHKAYRDSGGSMNALITSLLTSDAFLYRKIAD
ncbi:MAG: DUF1588 domain-containing protein [Luteolibacter sp.]